MGTIIEFPTNDPPPFKPNAAVRQYLTQTKCIAVLRARIPTELDQYLRRQAFASDKTVSALACRILLDHALNPRSHGLQCASGQDREAVA